MICYGEEQWELYFYLVNILYLFLIVYIFLYLENKLIHAFGPIKLETDTTPTHHQFTGLLKQYSRKYEKLNGKPL